MRLLWSTLNQVQGRCVFNNHQFRTCMAGKMNDLQREVMSAEAKLQTDSAIRFLGLLIWVSNCAQLAQTSVPIFWRS